MYRLKTGGKGKVRVQLLGSGTILREVLAAAEHARGAVQHSGRRLERDELQRAAARRARRRAVERASSRRPRPRTSYVASCFAELERVRSSRRRTT